MSSGGTISVNLVHGFEVRVDGKTAKVPPSAQRLVAFVALKKRSLRRSYVAGNLWLDSAESRAAANLRSALWRLQRTGVGVIESDATHIALGEDVVVDIAQSERIASALDHEHDLFDDQTIDRCESAWRGDLLPDWYDGWLLLERERYRQLRIHALERLCTHYARIGRFGKAIDVGLAAIEAEPLRESAHRRVIEVHISEGNVHEARRHFEWCADMLRTQLGIEPSPSLTALCSRS